MMQALGARAGAYAVRVARRSGPLSVDPSAAAAAAILPSFNPSHERPLRETPLPPQLQQTRGFATDVDRMQHHVRISKDMQVSDAIRRVLAIENGDRYQQKQLARELAIEHWQRHASDTGSPACQIATLTIRIDSLRKHLNNGLNAKDKSTKRIYVRLIHRRRKMLMYLKRTDFDTYRRVHQELGLT